MKYFRSFITKTTAAAALAFAMVGWVQAAYITVEPLDPVVQDGDQFVLKVVGREFDVGTGGTLGGGFSLAWDPALLTLDSQVLTFPGDKFFGNLGVVDNVAGTLSNASVLSLSGTALQDFDIAELTFTATNNTGNPLISPTDVSIGMFIVAENIWVDNDLLQPVDINPAFIDGRVTVVPRPTPAVPIPAAVWLFGPALLGMLGVARRRRA